MVERRRPEQTERARIGVASATFERWSSVELAAADDVDDAGCAFAPRAVVAVDLTRFWNSFQSKMLARAI